MSFLPRLFSSATAGPSRRPLTALARSPLITLESRSFSTSTILAEKQKTNKSVAARFKRTGNGRWKRWSAGQNHGHTEWASDRLNSLGRAITIKDQRLARTLRRMMPYT